MKRAITLAILYLIAAAVSINGNMYMFSGRNNIEHNGNLHHIETGLVNTYIDGDYIIVETDSSFYTSTPGLPRLPAMKFVLKGSIDTSMINIKSSIENIHISGKIMPVQYPKPKTGTVIPFAFNESFYSSGVIYPEKIWNAQFAGMEGNIPVWIIEVFPVQYDMNDNSLIVHNDIMLDTGPVNTFDTGLGTMPSTYMFVTSTDLYPYIMPLINWKMMQGFQVRTMFIDSSMSNSEIKDSIKNIYDSDPLLRFVLLAGDVDLIPHFIGTELNNPPTDLYYSLMDTTDYMPDLLIGRLPTSDSLVMASMIDRIINYERGMWLEDDAWTSRAFLMASNDYNYHTIAENTQNYTASKLRALGMTVDSMFYYYNSGTPLATAFNNGVMMGFYSGHGTYTSWSGPPFSQASISGLSNGDMNPLIFSFACQTSNYALSYDCFGETWVKNSASSFIGSSVYSYWDEDDFMQRGIIDAFVDSGITYTGEMLNMGKLNVYNAYAGGGLSKRYYEMYNILGDPSMDVFSKTEGELHVQAPPYISSAMSSVDIEVTAFGMPVENALVSYITGDMVIDAQYTDASGMCSFAKAGADSDTVFFYATRHNYKPGSGESIIRDSYFYLLPAGIEFTDTIFSLQNPDSMFSAGDSGTIRLKVANFSNDSLMFTYAIIKSLTPSVTLPDSIMQVKSIIHKGDTVLSDSILSLYVSGNAADYEKVTLEIALHDSIDAEIYTQDIYVNAPEISYGGHNLLFTQEEYILSPDTIKMTVDFHNEGRFADKGMTCWMVPVDSAISFTEDTFRIESMMAGDSAETDTFTAFIGSGLDSIQSIRFAVHMLDTLGNHFIFNDSIDFGRYDYIVIDYDPDHSSGPFIDSVLSSIGYTGIISNAPSPDDIPKYRNIFLTRGVYATTALLSSSNVMAKTLDSLMLLGTINMYMEGGECWYWDVINGGYNFNLLFGINALSDGLTTGPLAFTGYAGTFTYDQYFNYSGPNAWLDLLEPDSISGGFGIFRNGANIFGIACNHGDYRTVGLSFELSGLNDSMGNSTRSILLERIMEFFETGDMIISDRKQPKGFMLESVSPNPFREKVSIKFSAIPGTTVSIDIYDISGRNVHSRIMEVTKNTNTYSWSPAAGKLSSGIYFLRISNGIEQAGSKLIHIK